LRTVSIRVTLFRFYLVCLGAYVALVVPLQQVIGLSDKAWFLAGIAAGTAGVVLFRRWIGVPLFATDELSEQDARADP